MRGNALVSAMAEEGDLGARVYSINQNYSWGRDMEEAILAAAEVGGYEVVDSDLHEVNRIQDFSPFVAKIRTSQPDTVMTGNWSNDLLLLMKAAGDAGLTAPATLRHAFEDDDDALGQRVADHLHRLGQPDVTDGALLHFSPELFFRQPRSNLLLEGQTADARVLDAVDLDRVDTFAHAGEEDGQRVHDEPGIHPGTENGHLGSPRRLVHPFREPAVRPHRVRQLLGRRNDGHAGPQGRLYLRKHTFQ